MAKIALETSELAIGNGWRVSEVTCHAGPGDRPFEEQHSCFQIAIVLGGSFQYRGSLGGEVMVPGSLMLGNPGQYFECGHEHGTGDRCLSFGYQPEYFEALGDRFHAMRVPPLRELSRLLAYAQTAERWEEIATDLALKAMESAGIRPPRFHAPSTEARITRAVRFVENHLGESMSLERLAKEAKLSPFHFLRCFERVTGLTPHQYLLRARLRDAGRRLIAERAPVLMVALESGFADVSNFNRAFKREFGVSPRRLRGLTAQA